MSSVYIGNLIAPSGLPTVNAPQSVSYNGSQFVLGTGQQVTTPGAYPYTIVAADTLILASASGGGVVVNLPSAAAFPGRILDVLKTDNTNNNVSVTPNGTDTIQGVNAALQLNTPQQSVTFQSISTGWVII